MASPADATPAPPPPAPLVAAAPATGKPLLAVDVYGTDAARAATILAAVEPALRTDWPAIDEARAAAVVRAMPGVAWADVSTVTYMQADQPDRAYITIDLVETADQARRMRFGPAPTGREPDPEGLLEAWTAYEAKIEDLRATGAYIEFRPTCGAWHCFGDYDHPELAPLVAKFRSRVIPNQAALTRVFQRDADGGRRAIAAFLLAHIADGTELVALMVPAIRDPDVLVRNNAMRVLAEIALHHPEIPVPLAPVLAALDFPATLDRNKALAIVAGLVGADGGARLHRQVIRAHGETLLALLRLQQPNNHDWAYTILKTVSGKTFADTDHAAWASWLARYR